ncbi:hypothetical protein L916_13760 [Phytophthora nicotianae]|uniref:Uncharacterized protein n=1 Tax=Phytophthora nicotianae TaxID=4792 RepID=W2IIG8_PHYNI|nr:hypothetical protein L916_13760 [Phytophthora nicotianae]
MKIQFNLQYLRKEIQVGAAECIGLDCLKGVIEAISSVEPAELLMKLIVEGSLRSIAITIAPVA